MLSHILVKCACEDFSENGRRLKRKAFQLNRKAFQLNRKAFQLNRKAFQLNRKAFQLNRKLVGKSLMSAQQPTGSLTEAAAWEDRVLVYWSVKIRNLNYNVCSSDPLCFSSPKFIFWGERHWRWCSKFFLLMLCTALSHCRENSPTIVVRRDFIECLMIIHEVNLHFLLLCPDMILTIGMSVTYSDHCIDAFATCCRDMRPDRCPPMWPTIWYPQQPWLAIQVGPDTP